MLQFEAHRLLARSEYKEALDRYFALFEREQMLVVLFEEFVEAPCRIANMVLQFLGRSHLGNFPPTATSGTRGCIPECCG